MKTAVLYTLFAVAIALTFVTSAAAQCPAAFKLSGDIDGSWSKTTSSAWSKMLPKQWVDKGFHFYSRVRERGPAAGIQTPSDLESEIRKASADQPTATPNRRQIVLNIANDSGAKLRVIYDYAGKKTSKCELVTLTY